MNIGQKAELPYEEDSLNLTQKSLDFVSDNRTQIKTQKPLSKGLTTKLGVKNKHNEQAKQRI